MSDEPSSDGDSPEFPTAAGNDRRGPRLSPGKAPAPVGSPESRREQLYGIIFESESPAGRKFDLALLVLIVLSVVAVSLESVDTFRASYGLLLRVLEWAFTVLFTIEYALRIYCARRRLRYVLSFYGIVDLASLLPSFVGLFVADAHSLLIIRSLRLLRVARVLKVIRFLDEAHSLMTAIRNSLPKIIVFVGVVLEVALIVGALMYVIEEPSSGFTSVPRSMYWAIVTMTTVGYGDIAPRTDLGQALAAMLMIIGYGIIAVPTGIVSAELVNPRAPEKRKCGSCGAAEHRPEAGFCWVCGTKLPRSDAPAADPTDAARSTGATSPTDDSA